MMTNYHVLDEKYLSQNKEIRISLNDDTKRLKIKLNENRMISCNKDYDTTIIEIKPEEDNISDFMELDDNILEENSNLYYNRKSIYIIHYPNGEIGKVSYAIINTIEDYNICHYCSTETGSSGSPIINLLNNKIIGIHKKGSNHFQRNYGTYLKDPINEFINKYKEKNKIMNDNIINNNQIKTISNKKNENSEDKNKKKIKIIDKKVSHIFISFLFIYIKIYYYKIKKYYRM
jgi:V8-like Glu-specific endopeptidase